MFDTIVRHMGPEMERKTPKVTERYMCQGIVAKPLARLFRISEKKASSARVTTDRRKTYNERITLKAYRMPHGGRHLKSSPSAE